MTTWTYDSCCEKNVLNEIKSVVEVSVVPTKFVLLTHRSITDEEDTYLSKFNKLYYYSSKNINGRN